LQLYSCLKTIQKYHLEDRQRLNIDMSKLIIKQNLKSHQTITRSWFKVWLFISFAQLNIIFFECLAKLIISDTWVMNAAYIYIKTNITLNSHFILFLAPTYGYNSPFIKLPLEFAFRQVCLPQVRLHVSLTTHFINARPNLGPCNFIANPKLTLI